jgi:hypothetical protein
MKTTRNTRRSGLLVALLCASGWVLAQPAGGQGGPRKPPQEALDACKSLRAGDACSFSDAKGTTEGSCWAPEDKPLACRPEGAPDAGGRRPS